MGWFFRLLVGMLSLHSFALAISVPRYAKAFLSAGCTLLLVFIVLIGLVIRQYRKHLEDE